VFCHAKLRAMKRGILHIDPRKDLTAGQGILPVYIVPVKAMVTSSVSLVMTIKRSSDLCL
jgi:hypothetical protein